jgi:hypothetical protein
MESIAARANRTALNVIMEDCFIAFDLLAKYTNLLDSAGMAGVISVQEIALERAECFIFLSESFLSGG